MRDRGVRAMFERMDRETLVTFGTDEEAEVARSMLEGAGIRAWLDGEGSSRVALQVQTSDLRRAREFFLRDDEGATEALTHHPDSLAVSVRQRKARRAWFGAWSGLVVGALIAPLPWRVSLIVPATLFLWSLWQLVDVFFSKGPLDRRWRRLAAVTLLIDVLGLATAGLLLRAAGG